MLPSNEYYIGLLENRLARSPAWVPPSVAKALSEILQMERIGIYKIEPEHQTVLNRHVYKKVKCYTPEMVQVMVPGDDMYVFDSCHLFPIHTLEWCIASLEFFTEHCYELSWVAETAFAKIGRIMTERYSAELTDGLLKACQSWIDLKNSDWNRVMYETISSVLSFIEAYNKEKIIEVEHFIANLITSASDHMWSSKDRVDIVEHSKKVENIDIKTRAGIVMFMITSTINVKTKKK